VDPVSRREFWKLLFEFLSRGLTIVMATPYLDERNRSNFEPAKTTRINPQRE